MTDKENNPHDEGIPNAGTMASHEDWATAPPDATESALFKAYAAQLCRHQLGIYQIRQERMDTDIQRYFNSTPTRNVFARLMCLATYDNTLYTKTNIATELLMSRQAAHVMVEECLDAGWIEHGGECCGGKGYSATERLVWAMENYVQRHFELLAEGMSLRLCLPCKITVNCVKPVDIEQDWNGRHLLVER